MRNTSISVVVLLVAGMLSAGCSAESKLASRTDLSGGLWTIKLTSPAFKSGEAIPEKYTQEGLNVSPPLAWSAGPPGVKEWIIIVEDADERFGDGGQPALHWSIYRIPASVRELPEGAAREAKYPQGKNYKGETGYAGPEPSSNDHRYFFQIFAMDEVQDFGPGLTRPEIGRQLKGTVLSKGQLIGTYQSPEK